MTIVTLGLDLGKNWIHMVGFEGDGSIVLRRRVRWHQLPALTANMPACLIGMEACSGAHHLARALQAQGHTTRLMPPQYVKPFVKANKNDYRDAEANAEAVRRPTMRFVPVKNEAQLDPTDHPPCAAAAGGPAHGTD
jgi:transposase